MSVKNKIRIILMILFFIVLVLLLCGCAPFLQVQSTIPLHTTTITFVNNTNIDVPLHFLIDGVEKATASPTETRTFNYWVGSGPYGSWSIQVSVTILDRKNNRSWSDVVYFSSYYKLSYVFTVREDENGRLQVERRN